MMPWLRCCFASLSLVVVCCSQGNSFSLTECNAQQNFFIVENHETSMTCMWLVWSDHVHWTITGPATNGVETTVASCRRCTVQPCFGVCLSPNPNYEISRNFISTTLQFKNNLNVNNGAVVKCSNAEKTQEASCTINVIKAYKIDNCVNNEVDVIEGEWTSIRCSGLDSSQNMYWKATNLYGRSFNIAECEYCSPAGLCPACWVQNNHFRVTRSGEFSVLQIRPHAIQKNGWTLICSKKDDATLDHCKIHIKYHMPQCHNGILQIWETQPQTPILCDGLAYPENMNWTITDNNGSPFLIATCLDYYRRYKCSSTDADFSASRNVSVSQLVMDNYVRDRVVNKTLTCIRRDGARRDSCRIRAVYPAKISRRSVTLNGWTVTGIAMIDKVYDSDKDIVCFWNLTGPNSIRLMQYQRPNFSPFMEAANSRKYYQGACNVSIPVNATEGVYRLFLTVLPAGGPSVVGNVTLKKPGSLIRLPACPQYIAEGSNLECTCRHALSLEGSPPARVTWLNHDATSVLRTNDDDASVLRFSSVRREQNGTTYTCRSVWGPDNDVTGTSGYTLRVAYGPASTSVISQANVTDDTQHLTLTCRAHDVYPSANFTWSVPCLTLNLTSPISTCTLAQKTMRETTEVICLAINREVPVLNASGVYTAPVLNKLHNAGNGADGSLGLVVGGSITAVVVIAAVVVVVVIIVFRRKGSPKPASAKHGDAFREYINEFYESTDDVEPPNLQRQNLAEHNATPPPLNSTPHHNTEENTTLREEPSPNNDVYAVVVKTPKGATLKTKSKENQAIENETYAEVHEKPKGDHSRVHAKSSVKKVRKDDVRKSETSTGQDDTAKRMSEREEVTEYANCPPESTGENSEDVYMNTGQSSPLTESNKEVTRESATDDEYNELSFARPQTGGDDGHYNHLGGL